MNEPAMIFTGRYAKLHIERNGSVNMLAEQVEPDYQGINNNEYR
jgi:hypothetical protein